MYRQLELHEIMALCFGNKPKAYMETFYSTEPEKTITLKSLGYEKAKSFFLN